MPSCTNCGNKVEKEDKFCQECGKKLGHKKIKSKGKKTVKKHKTETYTCAHCDEDFDVENILKEDIIEGFSVKCDHCGREVEIEGENPTQNQSPEEKVVENHTHYERQGMSGAGKFIIFLVVLGIIGFIFFLVVESGALDEFSQGSGVSYVDPCERAFNDCNRGCGEGWLAGACKEKCSYDYRNCRS